MLQIGPSLVYRCPQKLHTDNKWVWRRPRQLLCFRCMQAKWKWNSFTDVKPALSEATWPRLYTAYKLDAPAVAQPCIIGRSDSPLTPSANCWNYHSNAGHDTDSRCRHRPTTGRNRTNYPLLGIEVRPTALPSLLRLSTTFDRQLVPPFPVPSEL